MLKLFYVGLGGFLGSVARYWLSGLIHRMMDKTLFPVGTLSVNIIGCFLIGILGGIAEKSQVFSPELRIFLFIGFLGGFTTFSTFGYEILTFARDGEIIQSLANLGLHLVLGLGAVWAGLSLAKVI